MRVLLLDNLDSFTHNVRHRLVEAGAEVQVLRVDTGTMADLESAAPDYLVLSPGPGRPEDARLSLEAIRTFTNRIPILGICLGHQCLAIAFGGAVGRASEPVHGKISLVHHRGEGLFAGFPSPLEAGRYHSLTVTRVPEDFELTAWTAEGTVMAMRHRTLPIAGLQFHPDSFLTPCGLEILTHALHRRF